MSIARLDDVRTGRADQAASPPMFLLPGLVHRDEFDSSQLQMIRRLIMRSGALVLGCGVGLAIIGAALGAYLLGSERPPKLSADATHVELPVARMQEEGAITAPAAAEPDTMQTTAAVPPQQSPMTSAAPSDPGAPAMVRTERVEADPSVWVGVRKFSPIPPEEVPVLDDAPPTASPTAISAMPHLRRAATRPNRLMHAKPHRHRPVHSSIRPAQEGAENDAHMDVGGTHMTAAELQRDGSTNPMVNAFSSIFGPK